MYKVQFHEIHTWLKWSKLRHWKCQTLISALSLFITFYLSQQWHNLKKMFLRYSVYSCIVTETMSLRTRYFLMSTWFVINFKVDSTAVSILVVILVELTNTVFVNSTNITTNIETAALCSWGQFPQLWLSFWAAAKNSSRHFFANIQFMYLQDINTKLEENKYISGTSWKL